MPIPQRNDHGATAVEYALFVALVALVIILAVTFFGDAVADLFVADWPWD